MNTPPQRILITAGPTHEPIDAVRYIANRSSGRVGIAIAEECASRGHATTLLLGPTHLEPESSSYLRLIRFRTAADLRSLLREQWPDHDLLIMAAAVADYRPAAPPTASPEWQAVKLPRSPSMLTLALEPTPDLLAELVAATRADQTVIGFALEPTDRLIESARGKLDRKGLDAIVANPLETMDADTISATLIRSDGGQTAAPCSASKREFARWLMNELTQG